MNGPPVATLLTGGLDSLTGPSRAAGGNSRDSGLSLLGIGSMAELVRWVFWEIRIIPLSSSSAAFSEPQSLEL